ncbi:hypothetical protein J6590_084645 [Homalodisca vitripennis]|nr:hypothetical protein J6590_084645 [Homalodisca vitripennis]
MGPGEVYLRSYQYDVVNSIVYGSLQPFTWSLAVSWVIYVCHTQQAEFLNRKLSWKGFIVFSRISYAVYIMQFIVMFWNILSAQAPQYIYISQIIDLNEIFCILVISTLSTLLFLLPLKSLYEVFTEKEISQGNKKEK